MNALRGRVPAWVIWLVAAIVLIILVVWLVEMVAALIFKVLIAVLIIGGIVYAYRRLVSRR